MRYREMLWPITGLNLTSETGCPEPQQSMVVNLCSPIAPVPGRSRYARIHKPPRGKLRDSGWIGNLRYGFGPAFSRRDISDQG
jgi:hypothetical protein